MTIGLAGCGGGGGTTAAPEPEPTPYETALTAINAATTAQAAQAAYDAVKDDVTAAQGDALQAAVNRKVEALATAARAADQRTALGTAAGMIDTSGTMTAEEIAAANAAIAALEAAIAAAVDVDDTSMYQARVDVAKAHVMASQRGLDHAAQTMELAEAVTALQAIDLGDLSTQAKIDAAEAAIAALRTALEGATELSDSEKAAAMTELATASRTVMTAQGRVDVAGQMTALSDAVAALGMIDLDALMTQAQIDAAEAAIIALDLALAAATDLSDAQKLDATVDVTVAKRRVASAQTALDENVGNQRMALTTAGTALAALDLDDLDTAEKIAAANEAVEALRMALAEATHLSDADKGMYRTQLDAATETVRVAQTGMDREGRMLAQRTAITSAVTMARTAVNGVNNMSTDSEVSAADQAIADLEAAIAAAVDLPEGDTDVAMAGGTVETLRAQLATAKTARTAYLADKSKTDMAAAAATGKAMYAAMNVPDPDTGPRGNFGEQQVLMDTTLTIDAEAGAGALPNATDPPAVTLKAGDSAGSLSGWMGTNYAHMDTGTKVVNEARVQTNRGPGERKPFGDVHDVHTGDTDATDRKGYYTVDSDASDGSTDLAHIMADAFEHPGTQTHAIPDRSDALYVRGTFDGAPGEYRCTGACSSTNDGTGSPSALGGTWHFKPDSGAMVHQPDANYLYYGWWLSKDKDGVPTVTEVFFGTIGTVTEVVTRPTGSATYTGNAVGQFAMTNPVTGEGSGGHFTADAKIDVEFGRVDDTGPMVATIDNFRLNGGTENPGWSVVLDGAIWPATIIGFAGPTSNGTTWSIDGDKAPRSGHWSADVYDELPGDPPDGDGSNLPTTVVGTYRSEYYNFGRMVGAFGADKVE